MGLELMLLPFEGDNFSQEILKVTDNSEFCGELLADLPRRDCPEDFHAYVSRADGLPTHYGPVPEDASGYPLGYVRAKALKSYATHPAVLEDWRKRAVWAYLAELPDEWKVALYWY